MTDLFDQPEATVQSNQLATVAATNPLAILAAAVERGADPDQLEKLLALQERYEANQAAKEFADAMADFHRRCPPIEKARTAGQGSFQYNYAAYEDDWAVVGPLLSDLGIVVSYSSEPRDSGIMGTIYLTKGVHTVSRTMYVPLPGMKVNNTQQYGAAVKYVKRYLLEAALNLVTSDDVDDDAGGCYETISDEQTATLNDWILKTETKVDRFLAWVSEEVGSSVDSLSKIPVTLYAQAIQFLRDKDAKARR